MPKASFAILSKMSKVTMPFVPNKQVCLSSSLLLTLLLSSCASNSGSRIDPYENYNRQMFRFNQNVYKIITPVVHGYEYIVPMPVRSGISNVYNNLAMVPAIGNDLLQGNFHWALQDLGRFTLNSTLGFFGIFDLADDIGWYQRHQSFGLTLAKWGAVDSPYIVLPVLGPSTGRGLIGLVPDYFMLPQTYFSTGNTKIGIWTMDFTQIASEALPQQKLITEMAIDPYIALRNAYLQNQQLLIWRINNPDASADQTPGSHLQPEEAQSLPDQADMSPALRAAKAEMNIHPIEHAKKAKTPDADMSPALQGDMSPALQNAPDIKP